MKDIIGIGIIGAGFARSTQIPGFRACPGTRVVALASGHLANAERAAREFGIDAFTNDWRQVVERSDVDLVSVGTPPALHAEISLAALAVGKAVLCEKPMAMNAVETRRMSLAARNCGGLALVDHELRFLDCRRRMKKMIQEGVIGMVRHIALSERRDSRANPSRRWNWWADREQGGGELGALGSHMIDTLHWLLDSQISDVSALLSTHISELPDSDDGAVRAVTSDDSAKMLVRLSDGAYTEGTTGSITMSAIESGPAEHRVEVFGAHGALMTDQTGRLYHAEWGAGEWKLIETTTVKAAVGMNDNEWGRGFTLFSRAIVEALRAGETTIDGAATFDDGHRTQLVLDAARRSNESRCWVTPDISE